MATAIQEKTPTRITQWLGEIVALESHIEESMDKQLKLKVENPELVDGIQGFHDAVLASKQRAIAFNDENGIPPSGNTIVKTAAAVTSTVIGKASGIVDLFRHDSAAKSLRDDYVAYNAMAINYTMLHTTSMAMDDKEAMAFAEAGLRTYAGMVQEINNLIPLAVIEDLRNAGEYNAPNNKVVDDCRKFIDSVWKSTAK